MKIEKHRPYESGTLVSASSSPPQQIKEVISLDVHLAFMVLILSEPSDSKSFNSHGSFAFIISNGLKWTILLIFCPIIFSPINLIRMGKEDPRVRCIRP